MKLEKEFPKLEIVYPNGYRYSLGIITEMTSVPSFPYQDDYVTYGRPVAYMPEPNKAIFEVSWLPVPSLETAYLVVKGKLPPNNWLKMHGGNLRRKRKRNET